MTGVEILNAEVVYVQQFSLIPLWICLAVGVIVGFFFQGFEYGFDLCDAICGALSGLIVGGIVGLLLMLPTAQNTNEVAEIKYQVTISDEVNFNDFVDKYEIVKQEGKIYTVKERE